MAAKTKKTTAKKTRSTTPATPVRRLKAPHYHTLRPSRRIEHPNPGLPGAFRLLWRSAKHLQTYWRLYLGLLLIYGVLNIVLVHGLSSGFNVSQIKDTFSTFFTGGFGGLRNSLAVFGLLVGSSGTAASDVAGVYQSFLLIMMSLALVWALRQTYAKQRAKIRIRDAFYSGMYPFIPVLLLLAVIGLQLIPLLVGGAIYGTVISNGLALTWLEKFLWGALFFLLALLSLYMITSSLFALYIVTLPDMTPMKALRSARQLVLYRRWTVLRKILFLPLALLILTGLLTIPTIMIWPPAAEWVFFGCGILSLGLAHSYLYSLYRELL